MARGRRITPRDAWLYVVLGAGLICLSLIQFVRSKPLDTRDPTRLAGPYRGLTFVGMGWLNRRRWLGSCRRCSATDDTSISSAQG